MAGKSKSLKWYGKPVTAKMQEAQIEGVNQTMAASATDAKQNHTWQNQTGTLEGSIDIAEYAKAEADGVRGTWGARDIAYGRIQELGGTIKPKRAKALAIPDPKKAGGVILVKSVTIPPRPYLRPAADVQYPKLGSRIRRAFERRSKKK